MHRIAVVTPESEVSASTGIFQSVVPKLAASTSPGNLLEMQILRPPGPTGSKSLGVGPAICVLTSPQLTPMPINP